MAAATRAQSVAAIVLAQDAPRGASQAVAALSVKAANFADDPADFVAALLSAWRSVALHGDADLLRPLLSFEVDARLGDPAGDRMRASDIVCLTAAMAVASARGTYAAEQDASTARAELARIATPAIEAAGMLGVDALEWLSRLTGQAALELSRIAANRAPLVMVETGVSLSAIRAAHDLYGDANRAGEIVARNRAAAAAFLPVVFEALSR
ncbi:hypothetical protein SAMN04488498_104334 [Mesorhizobium albiziae]|uniref:Uncharacterized protein n=2 Tax=Neomesorhizobium albiziae TaxID=335020 RepID=A0A1I3YDQ2_9HYPH|nr:hypothetical protein SAMN04488498_104334 [Mesorhizobium albiziae]